MTDWTPFLFILIVLLSNYSVVNNLDGIKKGSKSTQDHSSNTISLVMLERIIWILIVLIVAIVMMVLENKYRLLDRCLHKWCKDYRVINTNETPVTNGNLQQKFEQILNLLKEISSSSKIIFEIVGRELQFQLQVNNNDNIIQVKRMICLQWSDAQSHYHKIMRLSYQGEVLEDNRYLMQFVTDKSVPVQCKVDETINADDIVIIKQKSFIQVPKRLQMQRNKTIKDLRTIFSWFVDCSDFLIVKGSQILNNDSTIRDCGIKDGECISVIKKQKGKLYIRSVFEEKDCLGVEYSNLEKVSTITRRTANKFDCNPKYFALFLNNKYLDEDKLMLEYNIDEKSPVKYICLMEFSILTVDYIDPIDEGYVSFLCRGEYKNVKKSILLLKINNSREKIIDQKSLLTDLVNILKINGNPSFVKLETICCDDDNKLYLVFENMSNGTLGRYLKSGNIVITQEKIAEWSKQILQSIKILHLHDIVIQDLKPYEIMVDENGGLKLQGYQLSMHSQSFLPRVNSSFKNYSSSFISPETREKMDFHKLNDVWSFGVVLIYIINMKSPSINLDEIDKLVKKNAIKDKFPKWVGENLRDFIDCCLKYDQDQRWTIDQLLDHPFINE